MNDKIKENISEIVSAILSSANSSKEEAENYIKSKFEILENKLDFAKSEELDVLRMRIDKLEREIAELKATKIDDNINQ